MMHETRKNRSGAWVTSALIGGMIMLVWVNHTLLEYRPELWRAFSNAGSGIPPRAAVLRWDAARLFVGIVLFPTLGLLLWWIGVRRRALGTWGAGTMLVFVVGLASMAFHLQWMYPWGSERHLELPVPVVRAVTFLSLNAPVYLAAIGAAVLLRRLWLSRQRRDRHA